MATMNGAFIHDVVINEMADAFNEMFEGADESPASSRDYYIAAIKDDCAAMGRIIYKHRPDYNMFGFYRRAGYIGTYPQHRS